METTMVRLEWIRNDDGGCNLLHRDDYTSFSLDSRFRLVILFAKRALSMMEEDSTWKVEHSPDILLSLFLTSDL